MSKEQTELLTSDSSVLIFGSYGKKYIIPYLFSNTHSTVKRIIISGKNFSLDNTAHDFYKKNGTEIITDPGTVLKLIH